jgi:hypothetical protein
VFDHATKNRRQEAETRTELFLHKPTGQWTAKFNGKFVYFGKDPDEALSLYQKELPERQAGRNPRAPVAETEKPGKSAIVS